MKIKRAENMKKTQKTRHIRSIKKEGHIKDEIPEKLEPKG
jgi:hypothetical protein